MFLLFNLKKRKKKKESEKQNSAVAVFGFIFVGEIEQKQAICCLKCKYLN